MEGGVIKGKDRTGRMQSAAETEEGRSEELRITLGCLYLADQVHLGVVVVGHRTSETDRFSEDSSTGTQRKDGSRGNS